MFVKITHKTLILLEEMILNKIRTFKTLPKKNKKVFEGMSKLKNFQLKLYEMKK